MSWKNWPGWLKGGIVGVGILIVYTIFIRLINWILGGVTSFAQNTSKFVLILVSPFVNIITSFFLPHERYGIGILSGAIAVFILTPLLWFLIGALIGFIISKIKQRKNVK